MSTSYDDVVITVPIADWKLEEVRPHATRIHYHPDGIVPNDVLQQADIWFTSWTGFPKYVTSLDQIPRTKVIQLTSGESDYCVIGRADGCQPVPIWFSSRRS